MAIGLIWGLRIIAAFQKWFQKLIHNPMNPLGTLYKSYLAIPIVVVISVLVTDIPDDNDAAEIPKILPSAAETLPIFAVLKHSPRCMH